MFHAILTSLQTPWQKIRRKNDLAFCYVRQARMFELPVSEEKRKSERNMMTRRQSNILFTINEYIKAKQSKTQKHNVTQHSFHVCQFQRLHMHV